MIYSLVRPKSWQWSCMMFYSNHQCQLNMEITSHTRLDKSNKHILSVCYILFMTAQLLIEFTERNKENKNKQKPSAMINSTWHDTDKKKRVVEKIDSHVMICIHNITVPGAVWLVNLDFSWDKFKHGEAKCRHSWMAIADILWTPWMANTLVIIHQNW